MNKLLFIAILFIVSLVYYLNIDNLVTNKIVQAGNTFKKSLIESVIDLQGFTDKHITQQKSIEKLEYENKELTKQNLFLLDKVNEHKRIIDNISSLTVEEDDIKIVKVLSYVNLDDFSKVWIDTFLEEGQVGALITPGNFSAGITVKDNGKSIGLLNGNEKCTYAVFIGEKKIPGIIHGQKGSENLIVKFIPKWLDFSIDDEVVTSGMDDIFFEGLRVGKVVDIIEKPQTKEAVVKPYAKVMKKRFFYQYTKEGTSEN